MNIQMYTAAREATTKARNVANAIQQVQRQVNDDNQDVADKVDKNKQIRAKQKAQLELAAADNARKLAARTLSISQTQAAVATLQTAVATISSVVGTIVALTKKGDGDESENPTEEAQAEEQNPSERNSPSARRRRSQTERSEQVTTDTAIASGGGDDDDPAIASGGGDDDDPAIASGGGDDDDPAIASGGGDDDPAIASGGGDDDDPAIASGGGDDDNPLLGASEDDESTATGTVGNNTGSGEDDDSTVSGTTPPPTEDGDSDSEGGGIRGQFSDETNAILDQGKARFNEEGVGAKVEGTLTSALGAANAAEDLVGKGIGALFGSGEESIFNGKGGNDNQIQKIIKALAALIQQVTALAAQQVKQNQAQSIGGPAQGLIDGVIGAAKSLGKALSTGKGPDGEDLNAFGKVLSSATQTVQNGLLTAAQAPASLIAAGVGSLQEAAVNGVNGTSLDSSVGDTSSATLGIQTNSGQDLTVENDGSGGLSINGVELSDDLAAALTTGSDSEKQAALGVIQEAADKGVFNTTTTGEGDEATTTNDSGAQSLSLDGTVGTADGNVSLSSVSSGNTGSLSEAATSGIASSIAGADDATVSVSENGLSVDLGDGSGPQTVTGDDAQRLTQAGQLNGVQAQVTTSEDGTSVSFVSSDGTAVSQDTVDTLAALSGAGIDASLSADGQIQVQGADGPIALTGDQAAQLTQLGSTLQSNGIGGELNISQGDGGLQVNGQSVDGLSQTLSQVGATEGLSIAGATLGADGSISLQSGTTVSSGENGSLNLSAGDRTLNIASGAEGAGVQAALTLFNAGASDVSVSADGAVSLGGEALSADTISAVNSGPLGSQQFLDSSGNNTITSDGAGGLSIESGSLNGNGSTLNIASGADADSTQAALILFNAGAGDVSVGSDGAVNLNGSALSADTVSGLNNGTLNNQELLDIAGGNTVAASLIRLQQNGLNVTGAEIDVNAGVVGQAVAENISSEFAASVESLTGSTGSSQANANANAAGIKAQAADLLGLDLNNAEDAALVDSLVTVSSSGAGSNKTFSVSLDTEALGAAVAERTSVTAGADGSFSISFNGESVGSAQVNGANGSIDFTNAGGTGAVAAALDGTSQSLLTLDTNIVLGNSSGNASVSTGFAAGISSLGQEESGELGFSARNRRAAANGQARQIEQAAQAFATIVNGQQGLGNLQLDTSSNGARGGAVVRSIDAAASGSGNGNFLNTSDFAGIVSGTTDTGQNALNLARRVGAVGATDTAPTTQQSGSLADLAAIQQVANSSNNAPVRRSAADIAFAPLRQRAQATGRAASRFGSDVVGLGEATVDAGRNAVNAASRVLTGENAFQTTGNSTNIVNSATSGFARNLASGVVADNDDLTGLFSADDAAANADQIRANLGDLLGVDADDPLVADLVKSRVVTDENGRVVGTSVSIREGALRDAIKDRTAVGLSQGENGSSFSISFNGENVGSININNDGSIRGEGSGSGLVSDAISATGDTVRDEVQGTRRELVANSINDRLGLSGSVVELNAGNIALNDDGSFAGVKIGGEVLSAEQFAQEILTSRGQTGGSLDAIRDVAAQITDATGVLNNTREGALADRLNRDLNLGSRLRLTSNSIQLDDNGQISGINLQNGTTLSVDEFAREVALGRNPDQEPSARQIRGIAEQITGANRNLPQSFLGQIQQGGEAAAASQNAVSTLQRLEAAGVDLSGASRSLDGNGGVTLTFGTGADAQSFTVRGDGSIQDNSDSGNASTFSGGFVDRLLGRQGGDFSSSDAVIGRLAEAAFRANATGEVTDAQVQESVDGVISQFNRGSAQLEQLQSIVNAGFGRSSEFRAVRNGEATFGDSVDSVNTKGTFLGGVGSAISNSFLGDIGSFLSGTSQRVGNFVAGGLTGTSASSFSDVTFDGDGNVTGATVTLQDGTNFSLTRDARTGEIGITGLRDQRGNALGADDVRQDGAIRILEQVRAVGFDGSGGLNGQLAALGATDIRISQQNNVGIERRGDQNDFNSDFAQEGRLQFELNGESFNIGIAFNAQGKARINLEGLSDLQREAIVNSVSIQQSELAQSGVLQGLVSGVVGSTEIQSALRGGNVEDAKQAIQEQLVAGGLTEAEAQQVVEAEGVIQGNEINQQALEVAILDAKGQLLSEEAGLRAFARKFGSGQFGVDSIINADNQVANVSIDSDGVATVDNSQLGATQQERDARQRNLVTFNQQVSTAQQSLVAGINGSGEGQARDVRFISQGAQALLAQQGDEVGLRALGQLAGEGADGNLSNIVDLRRQFQEAVGEGTEAGLDRAQAILNQVTSAEGLGNNFLDVRELLVLNDDNNDFAKNSSGGFDLLDATTASEVFGSVNVQTGYDGRAAQVSGSFSSISQEASEVFASDEFRNADRDGKIDLLVARGITDGREGATAVVDAIKEGQSPTQRNMAIRRELALQGKLVEANFDIRQNADGERTIDVQSTAGAEFNESIESNVIDNPGFERNKGAGKRDFSDYLSDITKVLGNGLNAALPGIQLLRKAMEDIEKAKAELDAARKQYAAALQYAESVGLTFGVGTVEADGALGDAYGGETGGPQSIFGQNLAGHLDNLGQAFGLKGGSDDGGEGSNLKVSGEGDGSGLVDASGNQIPSAVVEELVESLSSDSNFAQIAVLLGVQPSVLVEQVIQQERFDEFKATLAEVQGDPNANAIAVMKRFVEQLKGAQDPGLAFDSDNTNVQF